MEQSTCEQIKTFEKENGSNFFSNLINEMANLKSNNDNIKGNIEKEEHVLSSYWELYVGAVLKKLGIELGESFAEGPDWESKDKSIIIEAVVCKRGEGENKAFNWTENGKIVSDSEEVIIRDNDDPDFFDKILLRITNAILAKNKQYNKWLEKSERLKNRSYIIAINTSLLDGSSVKLSGSSCAFKACFGKVKESIKIFPNKSASYQKELDPLINKKKEGNNISINLDFFMNKKYENISAILCSSRGIFDWPKEIKDESFELILNPFAKYPLNKKTVSAFQNVVSGEIKKDILKVVFKKEVLEWSH